MRYTAASLDAAARPIPLTIGRASSRRGLRRVSRWWLRTFRSWSIPPLSVPQMLTLQAARQDPVRYLLALAPILRAQLPRRWWHRVTGDPVALILSLPAELVGVVLKELLTIPGTDDDGTQDENPIEAIRRAQRKAVYGERGSSGPVPTLALAALTCQSEFGWGWYYAPDVWPTTDGFVPFGVCWVQYVGLQSLHAHRVLQTADGYVVANAKDPQRARRELTKAAFPQEVC